MSKLRYSKPEKSIFNSQQPRPGKVGFDARGHAVYEWSDELLTISGPQGERLRERALRNPALAIVNEAPSDLPAAGNTEGLRVGYNPYNSGELGQKRHTGKRVDLRELSKWIELKRRMPPDDK